MVGGGVGGEVGGGGGAWMGGVALIKFLGGSDLSLVVPAGSGWERFLCFLRIFFTHFLKFIFAVFGRFWEALGLPCWSFWQHFCAHFMIIVLY